MKESGINLLIFSRYPTPGQTKTRLIPTLGAEGAARLSRRMTEHAIAVARAASDRGGSDITICFTGARRKKFLAWLGDDNHYAAQSRGDLGTRLHRAFEIAFRARAQKVLAVGCDIPGISIEILLQAMDALHEKDVVLGPAADGGYYLIGMRCFRPELFAAIDWGTQHVFEQTCAAISRQGLTLAELPKLNDVDLPQDLSIIRDDPRFKDVFDENTLISIVIPTFNEAAVIGRTLSSVHNSQGVEIIVADGGSQDATCEIASRLGAVVLVVNGGKAAQMNAGAAAAKGRILLFLHADTMLPDQYALLIRRALGNPSVVAGAFRFQTDDSGLAMRLVAWLANFRSIVLRWPYGDQGIFMMKRVFDEMGGFKPLPIMEDFELLSRLRRRGSIVTLSEQVITSARRWRRLGVIRTTLINQCMIVGFLIGIKPDRLYRLYYRNK